MKAVTKMDLYHLLQQMSQVIDYELSEKLVEQHPNVIIGMIHGWASQLEKTIENEEKQNETA